MWAMDEVASNFHSRAFPEENYIWGKTTPTERYSRCYWMQKVWWRWGQSDSKHLHLMRRENLKREDENEEEGSEEEKEEEEKLEEKEDNKEEGKRGTWRGRVRWKGRR